MKMVENEYYVKDGELMIGTLMPSECLSICKKLSNIGIDCEYKYIQGVYYQYVKISNIVATDKSKIEGVLSNFLGDIKIK